MVISTDEECDVSSLPESIRPTGASELEGQAPDSGIVWSDEETVFYVMNVDEGELSVEEEGQLSHNMQEACEGKSDRKTREVGMSKEYHDILNSGGVVPLKNSNEDNKLKRNFEPGSCNKAVRKILKYDYILASSMNRSKTIIIYVNSEIVLVLAINNNYKIILNFLEKMCIEG